MRTRTRCRLPRRAGTSPERSADHATRLPLRPLTRAAAFGAGAVAGYLADARFGDPRRGHPVAGFGGAAGRLERLLWRDDRAAGTAFTALCVGTVAAGAVAADRLLARRPLGRAALAAAATWTVLGGTSLTREARTVGRALTAGDLTAARERLPHLCGRDPSALDERQLARAVVESVAENTADAVVNALVWGGLAGTPGLLAFRAVNTLDAMVGHRSPRYARFGWASARLDDVAGWPGARLTALLTVAAAPNRAPPGGSGGGTAPRTPAPTPGRPSRPSPARSASGWAGRSSTASAPSTGRSSARGCGRSGWTTSSGPACSRGGWARWPWVRRSPGTCCCGRR